MRSTSKTALGLVPLCLFLAALVGMTCATTSAIAQERQSDSGGDRRDSDERRERYRSWRRDRSEGDRDRDERRDSSSDRESSEPPADDAPSMATTDYVKGLIKQYDKNGNMMLDGDERRALRPPASLADANNDNVITIDELVARLSGPASKSSGGAKSTSTPPASESPKNSAAGDSKSATTSKRVLTWTGNGKVGEDEKYKRRTYRFTPAGEKLPTGLPSWFKSQDKNGDGQVAMSEYSRSWSKSTVAKFRGFDLDDDGVITAKEAGKK